MTVFDHRLANCDGCELKEQCQRRRSVPGAQAEGEPSGLMIIGEGPGTTEVARGMPFVGAAGNELNQMLEAAELSRDATHVTNATLCLPPQGAPGGKSLTQRFPNAVPSCLPRLEAEIAARRPRVIVAMGKGALSAATGEWTTRNKHVDVTCDRCEPSDRKIGPALACAGHVVAVDEETGAGTKTKCDWVALKPADDVRPVEEWHAALLEEHDKACPKCGSAIQRLKPRRVKCPFCGGKKKRVVAEPIYKDPGYQLLGKNGIAGALFEAAELPHRWDRFGVKYIITTLHPAYILRSDDSGDKKGLTGQFAGRVVVDHLDKARRLLSRDSTFTVGATLTDRPEDVAAFTAAPGLYTLDIETDAKSSWDVTEIRCIGIGRADTDEVLVVDTRAMTRTYLHERPGLPFAYPTRVVDRALYDALRAFLVAEDKPKEALNGVYDYLVMWRLWGFWAAPVAGDARLAHRVLWPDEPHTLAHIASEVTEALYWKPPKAKGGVESFETFTALAEYNAKDVRTTERSLHVMAGPPLPEPEMVELPLGVSVPRYRRGGDIAQVADAEGAYLLDAALYPIAIQMEANGVPVNSATLRRIAEEQQPIADELEAWLVDYIGELPEAMHHDGKMKRYGRQVSIPKDRIKLSSAKQLSWALYDPSGPCKLVCPKRTDGGGLSTEADVLARLADHEFVQTLLRWRGYEKTLSTYVYGNGWILREDGRIHPSWNFTPVTGRWSSSPNFQNIPLWLREAIEAPDGWVIVGADESQLELRIMAALSGDPELIRRCRDADESRKLEPEWDPHSFVASHFFGAAFTELRLDVPEEAKRRKLLREVIKSCIYGMNYGAGAATVLEAIYKKGYEGIPITLQVVRQAIDIIFKLFPGILEWREDTLTRSTQTGEVRSALLNRWRFFPKTTPATVAWNHPIQSTAADLVNLTLYKLAQALPRVAPEAQLMAQVHDAVYVLCREASAERVAALITETLSVDLKLSDRAPVMPFVASAKIGKTWDKVS